MPRLRPSGRGARRPGLRLRSGMSMPAAALAGLVALTAAMGAGRAAAQGSSGPQVPHGDRPVTACSICDKDALASTPGGGESYRRLAAQTCWIARGLSCDGQSGGEGGCWARSVVDSMIDGSRLLATGAPPFLACAELLPAAGDGSPRRCRESPMAAPGPLLGPAALVIALFGIVILGKAMMGLGQGGATEAWWHFLRAAIAWTMISFLVHSATGRTGAEALWDLFGSLLSLGAGAGALIVDAMQSGEGPECSPLQAGTGWEGFKLSIGNYLDRLLEIMAAVAVIARTMVPTLGGTGADLVSDLFSFKPTFVLDFLRFTFAVFLAMAVVMLVANFSINIAETVITTAAILALSPLLAILWVFRPTRTSLTSAAAGVVHAGLTMVVAGITVAIAMALTELSMSVFVAGVTHTENLGLVHEAANCEVREGAGLRGEIQRYLQLVACSVDGRELTTVKSGIASWIPALLLFIAGLMASKAILTTASGVSAELTGSRNVSGTISRSVGQSAMRMKGMASGLAGLGKR